MQITIQFDGGCNPNPGSMYGSYSIDLDDSEQFNASRVELGHGTSNEAEFRILIEAIHKVIELCEVSGLDLQQFSVLILTDSTIVRNRVSNKKKDSPKSLAKLARRYGQRAVERATCMGILAQKCVLPLQRFKSYRIEWQGRDANVARFGH